MVKKKGMVFIIIRMVDNMLAIGKMTDEMVKEYFNGQMEIIILVIGQKVLKVVKELLLILMEISIL